MSNAFRFLDLPPELCLMVYEHLPIVTHRDTFISGDGTTGAPISSILRIRKTLSTAILATSSFLFSEAETTFAKKLRKLEQEPIRLVMNYDSFISATRQQYQEMLKPCQPFLSHKNQIEVVLTVPTDFAVCIAAKGGLQELYKAAIHPEVILKLQYQRQRLSVLQEIRALLRRWDRIRLEVYRRYRPRAEILQVEELGDTEWAVLCEKVSEL
jgi:hypothetical protein